ncbi:hypothetical protein VH22019_00049 [Vibrio phage VH2_2019]|nr:hypothetical protein VH22019_00049 [Vibrio phage VH2_2019]
MPNTIEVLTNPDIVHQTFLAEQGEGYLPVGEAISLEYLSDEDDGIFETPKSWYAFLRGNFGAEGGESGIYLGGVPKETTLKKWCVDKSEYLDKFVIPIGGDQYVKVDPEHLELSFTYDANNYSSNPDRKHENNYPNAVEFFVLATVRTK